MNEETDLSPVVLLPKRKYTQPKTMGRYRGGANAATAKKRRKSKTRHPNQRDRIMIVDGLTGASIMRDIEK